MALEDIDARITRFAESYRHTSTRYRVVGTHDQTLQGIIADICRYCTDPMEIKRYCERIRNSARYPRAKIVDILRIYDWKWDFKNDRLFRKDNTWKG